MKAMLHKFSMLMAVVVFSGLVLSSCDDDNDTPPADKTELQAAIDEAQAVLSETEEGVLDGQFPIGSKAILQAAIQAAQNVMQDNSVTQAQVDAAVVSLNKAVEEYLAKEIKPIAESDLIAHWSFNEGTGTTANDNSVNELDGTFKSGHQTWGAGFPEWTTDRYGEANRALKFDKGANIEVPYNTKLNPAQMTIALWVNPAVVDANNRFLGLHSWNGYKFQLQSENYPFFTVNTGDAIYDRDAGVALPVNEWHHIAVTFGGGKTEFYIDGELVKSWDNTPGEALSISTAPYNLVIGQDFPTDKYAATPDNYDNDKIIPLEWGGYFQGKLDEIRMYKVALTATQIKSIYDREKP